MQKVTYERDIKKCSGEKYVKDAITYYEFWEVSKPEGIISGGAQDIFSHAEIKEEPTRGIVTISGEARFYPEQPVPPEIDASTPDFDPGKIKAGEFIIGDEKAPSGYLPYSPVDPGWNMANASNVVKRTISGSWNCCNKDENDRTVKVVEKKL